MKLSAFGEKFSAGAGILSLMDDLGNAMADGDKIMMGGGNPGHIPQIQEVVRLRLQSLITDEQALRKLVGIYDPPRGDGSFCRALASLFRREYGWEISEENICLTSGSQSAFFLLFNLFGGKTPVGGYRKILLPLAPEYIGYADLGIEGDLFTSVKPKIEEIGEHFFKYRVDFEQIHIGPDIGAICVSRPTNPTGNVLTDAEISELSRLAKTHDIPLIIDNAYGLPFPAMIYTKALPVWGDHLILCMSLSKFGLPAARTGIIIGEKEVIRCISGANAVINLATAGFGAMLTTAMIESGEIIRLSQEVVRPFYQQKMEAALQAIDEYFNGFSYKVHVPEGAMFLWLWFPGLPVSSRILYERLKGRGVVVVSGDYFFPGLKPGWQHAQECLRITYSQDEADVRRGISLIADEVRDVYSTV
ncbi:MAG: valine--pyruvate transaminase [Desulfobulbus sp.]|nr:valine--pyruvate transaminase [Desulfobulbus sp.]